MRSAWRRLIVPPAELRPLPPFLDPAPYQAAARRRERHRSALRAASASIPPVLAARRRDDARGRQAYSYLVLGEALGRLAARGLAAAGGRRRPGAGRDRGRAEQAAPGACASPARCRRPRCAAFYAAADLLVWPAVREAYGLAMLEAQAAGLPVVAGREGGVAEVVQDGITGRPRPRRAIRRPSPRRPGRLLADHGGGRRWAARQHASSRASAASRRPRRRSRMHWQQAENPGGASMTPLLLIRHGARPGTRPAGCRAGPTSASRPAGRAEVAALAAAAGLGRGALAGEPAAPGERDRGAAQRPAARVEPRLIEMDWGAWEGRMAPSCAPMPLPGWPPRGPRARSPAARRRKPARGRRPPGALAAELALDPHSRSWRSATRA